MVIYRSRQIKILTHSFVVFGST